MAERTLVDRLLDTDDTKSLELFTDDGEPMEFEQIAVLMYDEVPYTILRPLDEKENEVLVFEFYEDTEETIAVVEDKKLAQNVLEEYKKRINDLKVSADAKSGK